MIDDDLNLNNLEEDKTSMNRGVELLLRNKNKKGEEPAKTFQVKLGKIISFLNREIDIFFNFHIDFRKPNS